MTPRLRPLVILGACAAIHCVGPTASDADDSTSDDTDQVDTDDTDIVDLHPFDSAPQAPALLEETAGPSLASGQTVMLIINGRPSDANTAFSTNRVEESRIVGADVFVYDPLQPGKIVAFARPDYGAVDGYQGRERQKLLIYDLAWDPAAGLYAMQLEPYNDEWLLVHWLLDDWSTPGNTFETAFYGVPVHEDHTNSLYWEFGVDGMEFIDGRLLAGSMADYDDDSGGQVYAFDMALPPTYAADQADDDLFYMAESPSSPQLQLPQSMSVAGDLIRTTEGDFLVADASNPNVMADDINQLFSCSFDEPMSCAALPQMITLTGDHQDIEGLSFVEGALYGVTVDGLVLLLDTTTGAATLHDDLSPLFHDLTGEMRFRGATTVVLP